MALTGLDEENILLSLFAKSQGASKVVTKINRIAFDDVIKHLDLDSTIYPKNITADLILRYVRAMKNSEGGSMETLYSVIPGEVEAAEYTVDEDSPVTDIPLMSMKKKPDILIAMNLPSLDKYEDSVAPGGIIFLDSTLIERQVRRTDVTVYRVPATQMASDNKIPTLANMIIMGKVLAVTGQFDDEAGVTAGLKKVISAKRSDMLDVNLNAMKLGYNA